MKALMLTLAATMLAAAATAQPPVHGRVSFDNGSVMVRGDAGEEWTHATLNALVLPGDSIWIEEEGVGELEFAAGTMLRLADAAKAEIVALDPDIQLRAWVGSYYVQRCPYSEGVVSLETPAGVVEIAPAEALVRVDVEESGYTTVETVTGSASVRVEQSTEVLETGNRIFVEAGMLPSSVEAVSAENDDLFDAWNRERMVECGGGVEGVDRTAIGTAPLQRYGEWVTVDNEQYWRPRVTNYVPYREGYWSPVRNVGSVWVGTQPFSYITTHYGRWRYVEQYGWVWRYDRRWSPAWAATVRYGNNVVWAPVDWDLRPVVPVRSAYVEIGGLRFGVEAMSYVPVEHIWGGYQYVSPFRRELYRPDVDVQVWNLNFGRDYDLNVPFTAGLLTSTWRPDPVGWRGLRVYDDVPALGRVEILETKHGRQAFKDLSKAAVKAERTALKAGGARGRVVSLNEARLQEPRFKGNAGRGGGGGGGPKSGKGAGAAVRAGTAGAGGGNEKGQGQARGGGGNEKKGGAAQVRTAPPAKQKGQGGGNGGGNGQKGQGAVKKEQKGGGAGGNVKQGGGGNPNKGGGGGGQAKQGGGGNANKGGGGGGQVKQGGGGNANKGGGGGQVKQGGGGHADKGGGGGGQAKQGGGGNSNKGGGGGQAKQGGGGNPNKGGGGKVKQGGGGNPNKGGGGGQVKKGGGGNPNKGGGGGGQAKGGGGGGGGGQKAKGGGGNKGGGGGGNGGKKKK